MNREFFYGLLIGILIGGPVWLMLILLAGSLFDGTGI